MLRGGFQVPRGAPPALRISRKKGSFLRPPHVRDFVKEGYFICTQVRSMGLRRRVILEVTGLPSLLPTIAAAKQIEDSKI